MKRLQFVKASGFKDLEPLINAIEIIPCRGGSFEARQALSTFAAGMLASLSKTSNDYPWIRGITTMENLLYCGFDDAPYRAEDACAWMEVLLVAYLTAVRNNEPWADLLSVVHAELISNRQDKKLAQHFTPWGLVKALNLFVHRETDEPYTLADPTCGAGSLILGHVHSLVSTGKEADLSNCDCWGNDLDPLCAAMTALQVMANQWVHGPVFGRVQITVGDAITREYRLLFKSTALNWKPKLDKAVAGSVEGSISLEVAHG